MQAVYTKQHTVSPTMHKVVIIRGLRTDEHGMQGVCCQHALAPPPPHCSHSHQLLAAQLLVLVLLRAFCLLLVLLGAHSRTYDADSLRAGNALHLQTCLQHVQWTHKCGCKSTWRGYRGVGVVHQGSGVQGVLSKG
jgi:hypothetical protein